MRGIELASKYDSLTRRKIYLSGLISNCQSHIDETLEELFAVENELKVLNDEAPQLVQLLETEYENISEGEN